MPSPSPNKRQLKGQRSTIPLKLAPSGWNELAPYVYRNFTWLKGNDDSCSVLFEAYFILGRRSDEQGQF
jgi:hypothetical protein